LKYEGEAGPTRRRCSGSIAACHARARIASDTDWPRIAALYAALAEVTPSAVIELNRAIAVSMAEGPARGLALLEALQDDPALRGYPFVPAARGEQLFKLGAIRRGARRVRAGPGVDAQPAPARAAVGARGELPLVAV